MEIEDLVKSAEDLSGDLGTKEQIQDSRNGSEEEDKSSGVVRNFISTFVSRDKAGEEEDVDGKEESEDEASGGGGGGRGVGGGIINNLISNIFNQSEGGDGEKKSNDENGGGNEQITAEEEDGGGVMETIASHLPKPFSDGVAPSTEEASILIHSIVQD